MSLAPSISNNRFRTEIKPDCQDISDNEGDEEKTYKEYQDLLSENCGETEKLVLKTVHGMAGENVGEMADGLNDDDGKNGRQMTGNEKLHIFYDRNPSISNDFGVCGWILMILSYILIVATMPFSICFCVKVIQEYERAVIFRLGRLMFGDAKGPGIIFILPCIDTYQRVDLRVVSFDVPPQEILSKDSVTVAVDAVIYFRISNATISVTNVEDAARSTKLLAQTTLRNILGTKTLAEMLSDREAISLQMQVTLDEATDPWGVKVERVEVKDVRLPVQLQRAMAAEAEATREARARVIAAEGEQKASRSLKEAADVIAECPHALQLRYLQTLNSISAEKNSTIIFPLPIELLAGFLPRKSAKIAEKPESSAKIRPCCLYKYPEWVQKLVGPNQDQSQGTSSIQGGSKSKIGSLTSVDFKHLHLKRERRMSNIAENVVPNSLDDHQRRNSSMESVASATSIKCHLNH